MIRVAALAVTLGGIGMGTVLASPADAMPRVRSSVPHILFAIAQAVEHSPTLRRLLEAIARTDGIVYIEEGRCGHGVRSCLTPNVVTGPGYRILRIIVDTRQPGTEVIGSIAHELRHALEVLENPTLTSAAAIYLFYARTGLSASGTFETAAAVRTGVAVLSEVKRGLALAPRDLPPYRIESAAADVAFQ